MAGSTINIPSKTWVEVGTSDGSIYHKRGGRVVYAESIAQPVGFDENTPIMEGTYISESFPVYRVDGSVWAYAMYTDATITYTPTSGA